MDIRCYETDEGRVMDLSEGPFLVMVTEHGRVAAVTPTGTIPASFRLYLYKEAFEDLWAANCNHAPSDRAEA